MVSELASPEVRSGRRRVLLGLVGLVEVVEPKTKVGEGVRKEANGPDGGGHTGATARPDARERLMG